jgi:MFS family permease
VSRLGPALAVRDFRAWWLAYGAMYLSVQMIDVAIGWQVYTEHHSTLDLGLIGLVEFIPMLLFSLPAGVLADRRPRRTIFAISLLFGTGIGAGLAVLCGLHDMAIVPYLSLALAMGVMAAFVSPAAMAMAPTLVPAELLASAMTLRSIATRTGSVAGPALGGLLFAISAPLAYAVAAALSLVAAVAVLRIAAGRLPVDARTADAPAAVQGVLEGLRFLRRTPILLGAILLDLLGVLLGGAVALLPVYASSILHVGPTGLGILRAAPAIGALLAGVALSRRPLGPRLGRTLLHAVAIFGVSMVVFGLSRSYALSLLTLAVSGFADMYNMNIRSTISALATPDHLRGRVGAVETVFISGSNELGAFESGLSASLIGTVPAVVGGGVLTILLAVLWPRMFPSLAHADRQHLVAETQIPADAATSPLLGAEQLDRAESHVSCTRGHAARRSSPLGRARLLVTQRRASVRADRWDAYLRTCEYVR